MTRQVRRWQTGLDGAGPGAALTRLIQLGAVIGLLGLAGCNDPSAGHSSIGDAKAGMIAVERQACGSCHVIPGLENANGWVGPSLDHFASRRMVAGLLANTPPQLVRWLRFPQAVLKGNAMPDMGLSETQARNIAAYLETLK